MKSHNILILSDSIILASCILGTGMAAISELTEPSKFLSSIVGIPYYMGIFMIVVGFIFAAYDAFSKKV